MMRDKLRCTLAAAGLLASVVMAQTPLSTDIASQGRLTDAGGPAEDPLAMEFRLFNDAATPPGVQVGAMLTEPVGPEGGLFTVTLDFGAAAAPEAGAEGEPAGEEPDDQTNAAAAAPEAGTEGESAGEEPDDETNAADAAPEAGDEGDPRAAVGTAFTYQGQLKNSGVPANGTFDMRFTLYDDAGAIVAGPICGVGYGENVQVTDGLFTVVLDFGAVFNGDNRHLEIAVRADPTSSVACGILSPAYTTLSPRQKLTLTPYAARSLAPWVTSGTTISYSAGNVGVGTSTPTAKLEAAVPTEGTLAIRLLSGGNAFLDITPTGPSPFNTVLNTLNNRNIILQTGTSNVGIGTTSPSQKLSVAGTIQSTTGGFRFPDGTTQTTAATGGSGFWNSSDANIYNNNTGNVGIGTSAPGYKLDVRSDASAPAAFVRNSVASGWGPGVYGQSDSTGGVGVYGYASSATGGTFGVLGYTASPDSVGVRGQAVATSGGAIGVWGQTSSPNGWGGYFDGRGYFSGDVGIGTTSPSQRLTVAGNVAVRDGITSSVTLSAENFAGSGGLVTVHNNAGEDRVYIVGDDTNSGAGSIAVLDAAGNYTMFMDANLGITSTPVLQITGGSDLSEQFDVSSEKEAIEPGHVVCIDPAQPGKLIVSTKAYDRAVAGIISGAGGVNTGLLMGQIGSAADGKHPVALTGRVWAYCDASCGAIQPGDLLTTSDTPGHAMKATDYPRAQGAMIGKAMTTLEQGKGLVMVLVSLQ